MMRGLFNILAGSAVVSRVSPPPLGPFSAVLWEEVAVLAPQLLSSYGSGLYSANQRHLSERKWKSSGSYCPSGLLWAEVWADAGVRFVAASGQSPRNCPLGGCR